MRVPTTTDRNKNEQTGRIEKYAMTLSLSRTFSLSLSLSLSLFVPHITCILGVVSLPSVVGSASVSW